MLIFDHLKDFSQTQPDKVCLIVGETFFTYQELAGIVDILACRMAKTIKKGDKVIVKLDHPVLQLCFLLGIAKLGAASLLVDPSVPAIAYKNLVNQVQPAACIDNNFFIPEYRFLTLPVVKPEDLFLGLLSSGSTGNPKVIWRDHRSWVSAFPIQSRVFGISGTDILFLAGSLAFSANLNSCLHLLSEGGTVVLAQNSLPRTWLKEMVSHCVTAVFMVPANYRSLLRFLQKPLTQVKSVVSAGAKIDSATVRQLMAYFPRARVCEYYGAGELGHVSYSSGEDLLARPDSVGTAFPGVKIWTDKSNLIWVESPYLAPAYKPKATVGDMGKIDQQGYLYLEGRSDGLINKGGVKVLPEYVERILNSCPGIAESAVKGVADNIKGQRVAAWIVRSNPGLTSREVKFYCRENLPKDMCPQEIFFIDQMPRNLAGKLDRFRLEGGSQK